MAPETETVTQKDVFAAVDNVRVELGGKIDKLSEIVNQVAVSHEHRITIAEETNLSQGHRLDATEVEIKKHSDEIAAINDTIRQDEAAEKALQDARTRRSTTRRWVIATVIAVASLIATVCFILLG